MIALALSSEKLTLEVAGGKGTNLARLYRAGFEVPPAFILPTALYRAFVADNRLEGRIREALAPLEGKADGTGARGSGFSAGAAAAIADEASAKLRRAFSEGQRPEALLVALREGLALPGLAESRAFAVRSSATAEDLPDFSFAGQQDSFLNVMGEEGLLAAVVECWGSLWTARAIAYRARNGIPQAESALAVVVQAMVPSEVSGVLFTANPLSGLRSEMVVDATFGLGEALVSGQVEPDHLVIDGATGAVKTRSLGAKLVAVLPRAGGGVESVADREGRGGHPCLDEGQARRLAAAGSAIQAEFGGPQDIEWAFAGDRLHILQSRPVTSLFPLPRESIDPLVAWFSFGAVQGLVGPITPLGRDTIRHVAAGGAALFGSKGDPETFRVFAAAGERIWIEVSGVMRNPLGGRLFPLALAFIEPSIGRILGRLAEEPGLRRGESRLRPATIHRLLRFFLPLVPRMIGTMLRPEAERAAFDAAIDGRLAAAEVKGAADRFGLLANTVAFMRTSIASAFSFLLPKFIPLFGPSMASLNLLKEISPALAMEVTRALPDNVTTEMDLALWEVAREIGGDGASAALFRGAEAGEIASRWTGGDLPPLAQAALDRFMESYGMRGVGEIDIGQPRWRERPSSVILTLKSYLSLDPEHAPDVVFARGEAAAGAAVEALAELARGGRHGRQRERLVRAAARRIRALMGARESPKFFAIRMMGKARAALLEAGAGFAAAGTLERAEDLAFLDLAELETLAGSGDDPAGTFPSSLRGFIAARRAAFERELARKQVPRVILSDGRVFYEGLGSDSDGTGSLSGSPVSPGSVEGCVRVVHDPRGVRLEPGEILVCPGTDPAWTPLFLAAGGLVTEVGGMMTHGSVVAREYGIPAVVGVHEATLRLRDGMRVRLDGSSGRIDILGGGEAGEP